MEIARGVFLTTRSTKVDDRGLEGAISRSVAARGREGQITAWSLCLSLPIAKSEVAVSSDATPSGLKGKVLSQE